MKPETMSRIGETARKLPGAAGLLDARVARRRDRALGYAQEEEELRFREGTSRSDLRLNVGAGPSPVPGWVNVDLTPADGALVMDATKAWPLADGSVVAVNSEHFLEHIDPDLALFYFSEAHRVLRPGGVIRTSTPDLRGLAGALLGGDTKLLETHRRHGYEARNHADMFNNYVYSWGHTHIYDYETIALLLDQAGFERIERVDFGESAHDVLRGVDTHDMDELQKTVVAVDAVKPD